jgi:glucose/arabinose dehydrogenase
MKLKKILIPTAIIVLLVTISIFIFQDPIKELIFTPRSSSIETGITTQDLQQNQPSSDRPNSEKQIEIVAQNLKIPWEIVFLPDESLLITERPGNLVRIYPDQQEAISIEGVRHVGEGGLLGLALDPDFEQNNWLYLYLTTEADAGLINRVERYDYDLDNNQLTNRQEIISDIPGAQYHDGGRIAFGPDGKLYITTGDATEENLAQDVNSLAGKILRINPDGSVPEDNPFDSPVYSYGHRNPQGLAWDGQERLWATEHGPSGAQSGFDEINLIKAGQNYGWPEIQGNQTQANMISPVIQSGANDTWAPAGAEIIDQTLLFVGLRGSALFAANIEDENLTNLKRHFPSEYGRLRVVKYDGSDWIYLATSNTDGRGEVNQGDDKIIRLKLSVLDL